MQDEIKTNAQTVPSSRGGAHGHLGLVMTPLDYQSISLTPLDRPINPGELLIPPHMAINNTQLNIMKTNHTILKREYEVAMTASV